VALDQLRLRTNLLFGAVVVAGLTAVAVMLVLWLALRSG